MNNMNNESKNQRSKNSRVGYKSGINNYKTVLVTDLNSAEFAISVDDNGGKLPLLFIHGFPFDGSMWRRTAEVFLSESANYRTIIPDLRGLGKSEFPSSSFRSNEVGFTMEEYADDLNLMLNKLGVTESVIVVGLSMGGYIAMQFAGKYKNRVAGLVLCNTKTATDSPEGKLVRQTLISDIHDSKNKSDVLRSIADSMIPKLFSLKTYSDKPEIVDTVRAMIESNNPQGVSAATWGMMTRDDTTELLKGFDFPTLVISGDEDKFTPPLVMKQLAQTAKRGKYVEITEAGHLSPMEQPEQFATALINFIKEIK